MYKSPLIVHTNGQVYHDMQYDPVHNRRTCWMLGGQILRHIARDIVRLHHLSERATIWRRSIPAFFKVPEPPYTAIFYALRLTVPESLGDYHSDAELLGKRVI